jgi:hypothetical protein
LVAEAMICLVHDFCGAYPEWLYELTHQVLRNDTHCLGDGSALAGLATLADGELGNQGVHSIVLGTLALERAPKGLVEAFVVV